MNTPPQVIFMVIEPTTNSDQEKLAQGLRKLLAEDPAFRIDSDAQTGQTTIRGIDELQLATVVDRLKDEFNVEATAGEPQVAYRETLTQTAEGQGRYIKTDRRPRSIRARQDQGGAADYGRRIRIRQRRHRRPHTRGIYQCDGSRRQGSARGRYSRGLSHVRREGDSVGRQLPR
jgi:peptide subunit release factor RF-3